MTVDYENVLFTEFSKLDNTRFKVNFVKQHIFICGGIVDITSSIPPSFRDRFIQYSAQVNDDIHDAIILAESFKDYFKENIYNDLLVFEDEIANLATLVLIFLESPGSLVELGMFCSRQHLYKKLLIVAPQEQTQAEDSFIYLGPLEHIRKKEDSSVVIYPWPKADNLDYAKDYLDDLIHQVNEKLKGTNKTSKFSHENSGHIALLIYEIIRLSHPILIKEIELALAALDLSITEKDIKRHLYLLSKLKMISHIPYSNYTYYYPLYKDMKTISFGRDKNNKITDDAAIQMSINQSYIMDQSIQARKRRTTKNQIREILQGEQL